MFIVTREPLRGHSRLCETPIARPGRLRPRSGQKQPSAAAALDASVRARRAPACTEPGWALEGKVVTACAQSLAAIKLAAGMLLSRRGETKSLPYTPLFALHLHAPSMA